MEWVFNYWILLFVFRRQNDTSLAERPKDTNPYPWRDPHRGIHEGRRPTKAAAPLCGGGAKRRLLYMGLSLGTGSCLWDARPAMCRFAYGFLPGSEHRALQPCVAFPIIGNRFQLLQIKSNNVPPLLFHPFPVSSKYPRKGQGAPAILPVPGPAKGPVDRSRDKLVRGVSELGVPSVSR